MRSGTKGRVHPGSWRRRNDEGFAFQGCGDADGFDVERSGRRCAFFTDHRRETALAHPMVEAEIRMDRARGGSEPYGRMGRMPSAPSLPIPRYPFVGPVDPSPETLWREIDNLVPSSLSILLPALNEEDGVEAVMKRISTTLQRGGLSYSVYLLDGQSTDQTRAVAMKLGAEVFVQSGHGKGFAFREYVPKIKEVFTDLLDSDGTYPPEAIPELVAALKDESPVVLGSRLRGSINEGAMSGLNYAGNVLLSWFASVLFATPISDVCSGMWAFVSDRLKALNLPANGFDLEADIL